MFEFEQPEWVKYWNNLIPHLEAHLIAQRNLVVENYLTSSFGYFSHATEGISRKITKHQELVMGVYPCLMQLQDMLRGNIHNQNSLLLSPAAFNLRVSFEIGTNLKYIYNHADSTLMLGRFADFIEYEKIVGRRNSSESSRSPRHH